MILIFFKTEVKWVESINGNPKAVFEHRAFTKDRMSTVKGKNWGLFYCDQKYLTGCNFRITIDLDTSLIVRTSGTHICGLRIGLYEALKAGNEKKHATKQKTDQTAMEITRKANRKLSSDSKDLLPNLDNQRRNISKRIAKFFPKTPAPPKTLLEIPYRKSTFSLLYLFTLSQKSNICPKKYIDRTSLNFDTCKIRFL